MPDEPEVMGLLALMLLIESRRAARTDPDGELVLLADQDRGRWDRDLIAEGQAIVRQCLRRNQPGPYQIQAAINAVHSDAPTAADTDWRQILQLYDQLARARPDPVVALNRAVAVAEVDGARMRRSPSSTGSTWTATTCSTPIRADLLRRLGRDAEAAQAYEAAIAPHRERGRARASCSAAARRSPARDCPAGISGLSIRMQNPFQRGGQKGSHVIVEQPVAVVTGANRGIGREVAGQLAGRGFLVVLGSRDSERGKQAASQLDPSGLRVIAYQLDVADQASIQAMARWVTEQLGRTDVVINNAAIHYDTWQRACSADLDIVEEALQTNLLGAWRTTQALLPLLRRSPHPRIINVSSEAGSISEMTGGAPAYSVSKAALNALTRLLAGELRADRILVNAVCPGWTATDMGEGGGRPIPEGAASVVWAALLPDDGPTGGFYRDGQALPW